MRRLHSLLRPCCLFVHFREIRLIPTLGYLEGTIRGLAHLMSVTL